MNRPRFPFRLHINIIFLCLSLLITSCGEISNATNSASPLPLSATKPPETTIAATKVIRAGVIARRSAVATAQEWRLLLDYLESETHLPYTLVPLKPNEILPAFKEGKIDLVFGNSVIAVQAHNLYNARLLTSLSYRHTGTDFAGLIIVRADSPVQHLADLVGTHLVVLARTGAAGGYSFQAAYLLDHGFDVDKTFGKITEVGSQDNVVLAVLNGTADVGFVATGQLEQMVKAGTIANLDNIRIIERVEDKYFYPHTTPLYPQWFAFASTSMDSALATQIQKSLLGLPKGHPALTAADLEQFVPAADTTAINKLLNDLHLPGGAMSK
jgi:phosphate/phosphite/phosphonate ABC transporter binding protein